MLDFVSPIADLLVAQEFAPGQRAAPCFEFYPKGVLDPLSPGDLYASLRYEVDEAGKAGGAAVKDALDRIKFSLNRMPPNPVLT